MIGADLAGLPAGERHVTAGPPAENPLHMARRIETLLLIEVENLAAPYLETIYIPFLSNHLQLGRPAVILLPEGWSPDQFTRGLSHFLDPTLVEKQVVFFGRHALGHLDNVRSIDDDPWKTLQEIRYEATQLERQFDTEATELFSLDTLENKYGVTDVKGMMAEITAWPTGVAE